MIAQKIHAATVTFSELTGHPSSYQEGGETPAVTLENFLSNVLAMFTIVGGVTFIIYFLIGAFSYVTAQGDREKVSKAQHYLSNGIIGMAVLVISWAILGIIGLMLGIDILDLQTLLGRISPPAS